MQTIGSGPLCVPDFGGAGDFRFPDAPATPGQIRALEHLIANLVREVAAERYSSLSPKALGQAFGVEERRSQQIAAAARNRGYSAMGATVLELLHGILKGKYPPVLRTPKNQDTRWLFQEVTYYSGEDWRELRHLSVAEMELLRTLHAAFRRDHLRWQGGS